MPTSPPAGKRLYSMPFRRIRTIEGRTDVGIGPYGLAFFSLKKEDAFGAVQ